VALKVRIGSTLQRSAGQGYSMHALWRLWQRLFPDPDGVADRFGWPLESFALVRDYADDDVRLVYPTVVELRDALAPFFSEVGYSQGSYELAERCPTLVLERR
jgi:hypothetical protein